VGLKPNEYETRRGLKGNTLPEGLVFAAVPADNIDARARRKVLNRCQKRLDAFPAKKRTRVRDKLRVAGQTERMTRFAPRKSDVELLHIRAVGPVDNAFRVNAEPLSKRLNFPARLHAKPERPPKHPPIKKVLAREMVDIVKNPARKQVRESTVRPFAQQGLAEFARFFPHLNEEKLMAKIPAGAALVRNIAFLIDGARLVDVPVTATEQYPKGLGPTVPQLAGKLPPRPDKVAFSCCAVPSVVEGFRKSARPKVVLAGIETHVCVLQTALDLLAQDFRVYIPIDAVASRFAVDHEAALRRLEKAGAILTTSEAAVFEWVGGAGHPRFKQISALVQERMKALQNE